MEGSRLFLMHPNQELAVAWRNDLRARMRARKMLDEMPGTGVVVHPYASPASPMCHEDRLYVRAALSCGSMMQVVPIDPFYGTQKQRKLACDEILDEWRERQRRSEFLKEHVGGWGDPYGKILIVGDRYNGDRKLPLPFSNNHGASRTLSTLLGIAGLREPELYFVNSFAPDGSESLTREGLAILAPYEIVTLGVNAQQHVENLGVRSYVNFPHPQYLGRFEHAKLESWGAKLKKLLEHVVR